MNIKEAKTGYNSEEMQIQTASVDFSDEPDRTKILSDSDDSEKAKMLTNSASLTDDSDRTKMLNLAVRMLRRGSDKDIGRILDGCGISEGEYLRWVQSGEFPALALPISRSLAQSEAPLVWRSLLDMAKDGNTTAIRLYFDIFGRDVGDSQNRVSDPGKAEIIGLRSELFGGDSQ